MTLRPAFPRSAIAIAVLSALASMAQAATAPVTEAAAAAVAEKSQPLRVLDISERSRNGRNQVAVLLSAAVDRSQDIQPWLQVLVDGQPVAGGWEVDEDGRTLWFNNSAPQQVYQIQLRSGLPGADGGELASTVNQTLETRALVAGASFSSDGLYLVPGQGLPVQAVNVDEVNLDFLRVAPAKVHEFLRQARYSDRESWYASDLAKFGQLVHSGRYALEAPVNTRVNRVVDLAGVDALAEAGLYLAVMTAPGHYRNEQLTWFRVTDMGLHARQYQQQLTVVASSLKQGTAMVGAQAQLLDRNQKVLASATTDSQGRATLPWQAFGDKAWAVKVSLGENEARLLLKRPALDLSEFELGSRPWQPQELFMYGPRNLYRAGETLQVSGLIRDADGRTVPPVTLPVKIKRPDGSEAARFSWPPGEQGYYGQQWTIPASAPLGRWQVEVEGPFSNPVRYSFQVEDFMPERMRLDFNATEQGAAGERLTVTAGEPLKVPVQGQYLYGAPADGNRLQVKFQARPWRAPLSQWPGFEFGDLSIQGDRRAQPLADLKLDTQGRADIEVKPARYNYNAPMQLRLSGSLYESGGRAINRYYDALMWPATTLAGIKPGFSGNPARNSKAAFKLIHSDVDGQLSAAQLSVKLIREERQYFWSYNTQRGWHYQWSDKTYPVASELVQFDGQAPASIELPVDWGWYRLEVREAGSDQLTSLRFHAGEDWYSNWQQSQQSAAVRPDQVNLVLDKPAYNAGDTARVKVTPPGAGEALLMLESGDQLLWSQRVSLPENGAEFEVPVPQDQPRHDLYLSALSLRPAGEGSDAVTPTRAMGLIHLPLEREDRKLAIDIDLPEKVSPDQTLPVPVRVTGKGAENSERWMTLAAVDSGILSLNTFTTPDPFKAFFGPRRYAVDARDMYHKVVEINALPQARQRFGGDADLSRGGDQAQADVQIVSLFSGPVQLDSQGKGEIPLELPYFNGELRLMALAWSEAAVGSVEQPLTVAAPLITQLAMPRFMAWGDQSLMALELRNQSGTAQKLDIKLTSSGPLALLDSHRQLDLAAGEKALLRFVVTAQDTPQGQQGEAQLQLDVASLNDDDSAIEPLSRQWHMPIRAAWPALTETRYQALAPGARWTLESPVLTQSIASARKARLNLASSVQLPVQTQLEQLLSYPYGCLEQTASRALPLLWQQQDTAQLSMEKRSQWLNKAVARLSELQRENGSFGLWDNRSPEEHWLTVYATDILLQARDQGVAVSDAVLDKAISRLHHYLASPRTEGRWSENPRHYSLAYRAYAGYVLAGLERAPLGQLRQLFDQQREQAASGLPLMHMALALHKMGDQRRAGEAVRQALSLPRSDGYLGDYGSAERDIAAMIVLLDELGPQYAAEQSQLALALMERLPLRRWFSTQTRAALYEAGRVLQRKAGQPWQIDLSRGGEPIRVTGEGRWQETLQPAALAEAISLVNQSKQPLYLNLTSQGLSDKAPASVSEQLAVSRNFYQLDGSPRDMDRLDVGELVLVELILEAAERTPDGLLVDLLPAGFELENPALAHAVGLEGLRLQGDEEDVLSQLQRNPPAYQAYRDDRYVAALELNQGRVQRLFYLMRAVTPGSYQIPPVVLEDMYRPDRRAISEAGGRVEIVQPAVQPEAAQPAPAVPVTSTVEQARAAAQPSEPVTAQP